MTSNQSSGTGALLHRGPFNQDGELRESNEDDSKEDDGDEADDVEDDVESLSLSLSASKATLFDRRETFVFSPLL